MDLFGIPLEIITAIALVIVTCIYVIFTFLIFKEQEKSRKDLPKPHISAKPYFIGPIAMFVQIINIGKGSALNVDVKCRTNPPSTTKEWSTNFLPPNESIEIGLDEIYLSKIFSKYKEIIVETSYYDIYEQPYSPEIKIDLSKLQNSLKGKGIIYKDDFHQQMENVIKNLHEISKNTKGLDKVEHKIGKLDDINKSLKRLNDLNINLKKLDDVDKNLNKIEKGITAVETSVRGLGPIIKKKE